MLSVHIYIPDIFLCSGFGFFADLIGRRTMFITTAALCILGNISCAIVGFGYQTQQQSFSVFHQLAVVRFLLGIGIGGEVIGLVVILFSTLVLVYFKC